MRKILTMLALFVAVAGAALAHGSNSHRVMGTVASIHDEHLTVTTTDGKEASIQLTADTKYEKDGKAADRSGLVEGARVSIQLAEDDKTALKIKIGSGGQQHGHDGH
jgi:hypothetical protein